MHAVYEICLKVWQQNVAISLKLLSEDKSVVQCVSDMHVLDINHATLLGIIMDRWRWIPKVYIMLLRHSMWQCIRLMCKSGGCVVARGHLHTEAYRLRSIKWHYNRKVISAMYKPLCNEDACRTNAIHSTSMSCMSFVAHAAFRYMWTMRPATKPAVRRVSIFSRRHAAVW